MTIDHPTPADIPDLRALWQFVFADTDAYLDSFFSTAFQTENCLCIRRDGLLASACYWLDCTCRGRKVAYLYAFATAPEFRFLGLCRKLLHRAGELLAQRGYAGLLLVPGDDDLRQMYQRMGFEDATSIRAFSLPAGEAMPGLQTLSAAEYAAARQDLLPPGAAVEGEGFFRLLDTQLRFYRLGDTLAACLVEGTQVFFPELLGDVSQAPGLVAALGASHGAFRTPGEDQPFAMYHPLSDAPAPNHFSFALD